MVIYQNHKIINHLKLIIMSDLILESYTDGCIRKLEDVINDLETALTYSSDDSYTKHIEAIINDINKVIEKLY